MWVVTNDKWCDYLSSEREREEENERERKERKREKEERIEILTGRSVSPVD